jgi:hypothetical protein
VRILFNPRVVYQVDIVKDVEKITEK